MRFVPLALPCCAALAACPVTNDAPAEGEGEAGEGEGETGEGEGEAGPLLRIEVDGAPVTSIAFGAVDAAVVGQAGGASERTVTLLPTDPSSAVALLTDPPILVAGIDAAAWSVVEQPASTVRPGGASFTLRFAPAVVGSLRGAFILATGARATDRVVVALEGDGTGPERALGLRYALYDGAFDTLPDLTALVPSSTGIQPDASIPAARENTDLFALQLLGAIDVPVDGAWTFFVTSDDGSRLLIDGAVVVDNDGLHGPVEQSGTATLSAGTHALEVLFFEKDGGEVLVVEWSGPDRGREPVPAGALSTAP